MDILNLTILKAIPIPVPTLDEQRRILEEVARVFSLGEKMETSISSNLQRADRLRQSILSKAFSGQLLNRNVEMSESERNIDAKLVY